ncbi:MAG: hypothetical protein MK132_01210 [Lentisphaerales bacterium]|nr:hypothetical protein [Lentisphaerales bacterium]
MEILCGPILRNVSSHSVNIWLAVEKNIEITGEVCNYSTSCEIQKVQVAAKLYTYLITLTPQSGTFPKNEVLYYDLKSAIVGDNGPEITSLIDSGELSYSQTNKLPSFVIGEMAPILSGSCRKPHSEADDMLVYADSLLKDHWQNTYRRPKALFMNGDQLYGDDCDEDFLKAAIQLGSELFGHDHVENFPTGDGQKQVSLRVSNPGDDNDFRRWYDAGEWEREHFINKVGMSSHKSDYHLILFSEYVSAYLLIWSNKAWDKLLSSSSLSIESEHLKSFIKGLPRVRRLLANISTYMIFDDHDVTDDWNINNYWKENITSPGKRLIGNAMAAYWLFQGWGNKPNSSKSAEIHPKVVNYIDKIRACQNSQDIEQPLHTLLNETDNWWFLINAGENCQILTLDIRSKRYKGKDKKELSGLSDPKFLKSKVFSEVSENLENLIIISPTPFFGFSKIENLQAFSGEIPLINSVTLAERESWHGEKKDAPKESSDQFVEILKEKSPKQTFIISGDVHYGFIKKGNLCKANIENVWQVTASALKNVPTLKWAFALLIKDTEEKWFKENFHTDEPSLCRSCEGRVIFDGPNMAEVDYRDLLTPVTLHHRKNKMTERHTF